MPDEDEFDRARGGPLLGEEHAAEGQVPGLLLAVILRDGLDHPVGFGCWPTLQQVGDLLAAEDEQAEGGRHGREERHEDVLRDAGHRTVDGVLGPGLDVVEEAHEEAGMVGLFPHVVQQVVHAGVGEVGAWERMSKLNPAIRTDSKPTPVSTMDANSSRARVRFRGLVSRP